MNTVKWVMAMKIFELRGKWRGDTFAGVVIAESEDEARKLMSGYNEWFLDPSRSDCVEVPYEKGVIMTEWEDR